jgi:translation initiation factor 1
MIPFIGAPTVMISCAAAVNCRVYYDSSGFLQQVQSQKASQMASADDPFAALNGLNLPPGPDDPEPQKESKPAVNLVPNRVIVRLEKKGRRGKSVTVLTGFDRKYPQQLADLSRELRRKLGVGGKVADGTVELQGDQRRKAADYLEGLGYRVGGHFS